MTLKDRATQDTTPAVGPGDLSVLLVTVLQALTNGCNCQPCATLRHYGKVLADLGATAVLDPSATSSNRADTPPQQGSSLSQDGEPPQTRRFDGTTKEM